jgi:guanine deaminase
MLRESADLARSTGTWWQSHVSEDPFEIAEVRRLFPDALDYVDVYDRAGALGDRTILAHAIHLSDREVARLAETGSRVAHCPASNLFIGAGIMPLTRWLAGGLTVGLGSDVSGGPDASLFSVMRIGAYAQLARRSLEAGGGGDGGSVSSGRGGASNRGPALDPFGWLRLATLEGARALGLDDVIGSLETGKEADLIAIDPSYLAPLAGQPVDEDPADLASRLIFRAHPDMVRAAWVRGRRLAGPGTRG